MELEYNTGALDLHEGDTVLAQCDSAGNLKVVGAITVTGGATSAKQDTIIGHVDGLETAVASTNTKLDTLAGHLDGVEGLLTTANTGTGVSGSATFTPAAASHTAGDVNGGAQDFALAAPSGCRLMITDATLSIAGATAEATAWRLYLYNVTPPSAIADDGVFDFTVATDGAAFLGYVDLGTAIDLGGGQWVENRSVNKAVKLSGTTVFGYLVNLTTLTPAAVAHKVTLLGVPI